MVALEAMECGLPIVSTQLPSIHFIANNHDSVIYANQNDFNDLANKMEKLMSDSSLVHSVSARRFRPFRVRRFRPIIVN
jgi:glycosyltransferase involved in cell wall biosynthesis